MLQGNPVRLALAGTIAHQVAADLAQVAAELGRDLDDLRRAAARSPFLDDVPPLEADLTVEAGHAEQLGTLTRSLAGRLRALDGDASVVRADLRHLPTLLGALGDLVAAQLRPAPPAYDPDRWIATPEGQAALAEALRLLDRRRPDAAGFAELIAALSPEVADAVVANLGDADLAGLVAHLERPGPWPLNGWELSERHQLWTIIGQRVSLDTFRRLATFTDDLDPPGVGARPRPSEVARLLDDGQITHAGWYDELVYAELPGWLAWHGEGDAHPFATSDLTQGLIGDCFLMVSMLAIAQRQPQRLQRMFTTNPNGTVTVTFADGTPVTVTPDVLVHPERPREPALANHRSDGHRDVPGGGHEMWPKLLEKAYAQHQGSWEPLNRGYVSVAVDSLVGSGHEALSPTDLDLGEVAAALGDRPAILTSPGRDSASATTVSLAERLDLTLGHAYLVERTHDDGTVTIRDPNRPAVETQRHAWEDLQAVFQGVTYYSLDGVHRGTTDEPGDFVE